MKSQSKSHNESMEGFHYDYHYVEFQHMTKVFEEQCPLLPTNAILKRYEESSSQLCDSLHGSCYFWMDHQGH